MVTVSAAGWSDIGKVRKANEDSYLLNEALGLYVVADGMGGHRGGAVASRIAVETIDVSMVLLAGKSDEADPAEQANNLPSPIDRLLQSIQRANQKIHAKSVAEAALRGMGTTVSALYVAGASLYTANVGDSPIYLLRNGQIENLYTPHTLLHEYKKLPKSLEGRYPPGKLAHILTRAVGIRSDVKVDTVETPCFAGDIVVLCSDGLSGKLSREEVRDMVYQNDLETACKKMTELALQRGGEDNITVIVVRVVAEKGGSNPSLIKRIAGFPAWIASLFGARKRS
ncbi:Protein serine/threonine phosphatase [Desulfosarcina cetonica]|nr:Protein serine/threonine phosphatase [Desulfosarcina cetonica]